MKVLLSIKPEFVEKIFSGEKRFEYRKAAFKNKNVSDVVIYSTMPVGKIVGEFKLKKIHTGTPEMIWERTRQYSGISKKFFFDYFKNRSEAYAFEIEGAAKYKEPLDPHSIFPGFTAPQSFRYLE